LRNYETVLIWNASLSEAELVKETGRVQDIVTNGNGELTGFDDWGRRQLAYVVQKQSEGVYHFVHWTGGSDIKDAIDKMLRINDNCLRHLTLKEENSYSGESNNDFHTVEAGD
jgi:small subunit ribosomal protein S6